MLKTIGIYVNTDKDVDMSCAEKIAELLRSNGFVPQMLCAPGLNCCCTPIEDFIGNADAVFVLGGDGTLLMVSKLCAQHGVPVLGINLGRVGFLSEVELSELDGAIDALAKGDYSINRRMMLKCSINGKTYYALNEIVLHRDMNQRMVNITVREGEQKVDSFFSDGVLVASPTGSTAYNLSAGGPIVAPDASVMLLTPISAHTLRARPYVFSSSQVLTISASPDRKAAISIDGAEILSGEGLGFTVQRAECVARFISVTNKSFYQSLNSKLNEWSTGE